MSALVLVAAFALALWAACALTLSFVLLAALYRWWSTKTAMPLSFDAAIWKT
jgi:hypothetical protein